ncbi:MAG: biotin transporter BioY [Lachnospiraceae bacterium]|nr:biotin transporter BioY [Lachnospiraceae bacterium]
MKTGEVSSVNKSWFTVKEMAVTAVMTAILCILGPWAIQIPVSPVPISLCSMGIYFVLYVLGMKLGTLSVLLYVLLGTFGLPVFTNFSGGFGKLLGPTGGYIIGYLFLAIICGFFLWRFPERFVFHILGFILGTCVLYLFGTLWLQYQLSLSFPAALMAGVIPYIPGDVVKLILAIAVATPLKKQLLKARLL